MLINVTPQETRIALMEQGMLQEFFLERDRDAGVVGNIYKGRVSRVLPGMQAAFLDIGLDRSAFLYAGDLHVEGIDAPVIEQFLHEGETLLVQVLKDPMGSKGARVTSMITLSGRYLVYMPGINHIGISRRIEDDAERERLRDG